MNDPIKAEQDAVTYREAVNTHGIDVITPERNVSPPRGKDAFSDRRTPYRGGDETSSLSNDSAGVRGDDE